MNTNDAMGGCSVESAHIAQRIVETHQSLHALDGGEGGADRALGLRWRRRGDANLDERAEERAGAAEFSGGF